MYISLNKNEMEQAHQDICQTQLKTLFEANIEGNLAFKAMSLVFTHLLAKQRLIIFLSPSLTIG